MHGKDHGIFVLAVIHYLTNVLLWPIAVSIAVLTSSSKDPLGKRHPDSCNTILLQTILRLCFRPRSAKALSKYSDLVDSLARTQRDMLEGASDEARLKLREWELPEALNVRCVLIAQLPLQKVSMAIGLACCCD